MAKSQSSGAVLYVRTEYGVSSYNASLSGAVLVCGGGGPSLPLSDVMMLERNVYYVTMTAESLREWSSFASSLRSVTLSSLFSDAGDISQLFKNAAFGGLLILVFVLLFQLSGLRSTVADLGAGIRQIQAQIVAPVQLQIGPVQ